MAGGLEGEKLLNVEGFFGGNIPELICGVFCFFIQGDSIYEM